MAQWSRRMALPMAAVISVLFLAPSGTRAQQGADEARLRAADKQGESLEEQGKWAEAIQQYEQAVALAPRVYGAEHPNTATRLNNLATLYFRMGRYAQAEPLYLRSLKIIEATLGPDHPDVALGLNNLATLYHAMGRYAQAEPLYLRSLKIKEATLGPDHPGTATPLNNLAELYREMRRDAQAEPLYLRSLKIWEATLGPDHRNVAGSLNNLASLYGRMGRYALAESLALRSLKIREATLGPNHPDVAYSLDTRAALYVDRGQYAEAEPLSLRSLKIREATLGPDHPDVAHSLNNLAALYKDMGRYAQAEPLFLRILKIQEATLGPDHPRVANSLCFLALMHASSGRWTEAVERCDRSLHILRGHASRVLPALAEAEQLTFLRANDEPVLQGSLSLGVVRRTEPRMVKQSAGWVLNGKGLAQQVLAQRALTARDTKDPAAAPLIRQLLDVRSQLAARTFASPKPGQETSRRRELDRLTERELDLSKRLGQVIGRPARDDPWVELDEVRKALPEDAVLVEFAKFDLFDFQARGTGTRWQPPHYAAWVIPAHGQGEIQLIDLGPAQPIEDAVADVRRAIQPDPATLRTRGEPDAEHLVRRPLDALSRLVLRPLLPHMGQARRWALSPDVALWLVPWAALPLEDGRYAIEAHTIQYLVSGRDLSEPATPQATGRSMVLADPDYDLGAEQIRTATQRLFRTPTPEPSPDLLTLRGLSRSFLPGTAPRVPGTAAEARTILPRLQRYTGVEPTLYTGQWALESVFKAFRRPRVVVLSTHGFFLDEPESKPEDRPALLDLDRPHPKPVELSENPLLCCGLLLAGANHRQEATRPGDEDGVLTGLEIVGTDLRGTELVVLSACETGLGTVHNGEGVAGLRQAFQLAGAQAVVATLWQVPDKESARLMAGFFDNLAVGQGKAEAMRQAQLEQIKSRRDRYGAAHPFFWAAYSLTGQGQ